MNTLNQFLPDNPKEDVSDDYLALRTRAHEEDDAYTRMKAEWQAEKPSETTTPALVDDEKKRTRGLALQALALGWSKESVEHEFGSGGQGATDPGMYDPIDLIVDISTGFMTAPGRAAIKGISEGAYKAGTKALAKNVAQDVGFGAVSGGFMEAADMYGLGPVFQTIAGIIGPTATSGLVTMSRKSLATWLKRTYVGNPKVYDNVLEAVSRDPDNKFSSTIKEIDGEIKDLVASRSGEPPEGGVPSGSAAADTAPPPDVPGTPPDTSGRSSAVSREELNPSPPDNSSLAAEDLDSATSAVLLKAQGDPEKPLVLFKAAPEKDVEKYFELSIEESGKAININLARIQSGDDVKEAIQRIAGIYGQGVNAARRGAVKNEETVRLADDLGLTVGALLERQQGQAFNAHELVAARKMLVASAEHLTGLAKKAAHPDASDLDKFAFRKALNLHYGIQAQVSGMTAEAGRALQSFNIMSQGDKLKIKQIEDFLNMPGSREMTDDMAAKISVLDSPEQLNTMVRQLKRATTSDVLLEAWINGLLSNPVTHATNTLSNAIVSLWQVPERFLASQIGRVLPGAREITEKEALYQAYGLVQGIKDGMVLAQRAFIKDESSDLLGKIEARTYRAISAEGLGISGNVGRAVDLLGTAVRVPGRFLMAEDELFKSVGYRMELNARAYRQASSEGLQGKDLAVRISEIINDPPADIRIAAIDASRYQTFTNELDGISRHVQRAAIESPALKIIIPFVRTPVNVMKFGFMERTPLGILSKSFRADVKAGGARRDLALARMSLGSMLMAASAAMTAEGLITGGGPSDPKLKTVLRNTGWQPYSIKIGDKYYSYARLEPFGSLLGMAADAADLLGQADETDADELASALVVSAAKNVTNKTFLRGLSEIFNVLQDPDRYGKRWLQALAGTVIPAGVSQVARIMDPTLRDARTIVDKIKSRIPGYSETLPPRRNIWGEPIVLSGGLGPDIISPVYTSTDKRDPVSDEILRLRLPLGMPPRSIDGIKLSPEEYDRFAVLAGNEAKDANTGLGCKETLESMLQNPDYLRQSDGPDGGKADTIREIIGYFRELARFKLREEFPDLEDMIMTRFQERQQARKPLY